MSFVIIHATDLSENHFGMCERAVAIAKKLQAKLYLLHVVETPSSMVLAQGLGFAEAIFGEKDSAKPRLIFS